MASKEPSHVAKRLKLTRSTLKGLQAMGKPYYVWDAMQSGFGVRVRETGSATYVVMFRLRGDPKQHFVTLGLVAEMAPEEARARAAEIKVAAREGRNLDVETKEAGRSAEAERRRQANDITVADLCERYLTHLADEPSETYGRKRTASTVRVSRVWLKNLIRLKGGVRLSVITDADLKDAVAAAPIKSRRAHTGVIKRLFAYAADEGLLASDPATTLKRPRPGAPRTRKPSVSEVRELLAASRQLALTGGWPEMFDDLTALIVLTGQRRQEVAKMDFAHVDFKRSLWVQPETSNKSKREHTLPLNDPALTIIKRRFEAAARPPRGLVLPSIKKGQEISSGVFDTIMKRLNKETGIAFRLHDLRRAMASAMGENGIPFHVADALLNHAASASKGGVMGVYQLAEMIDAKRAAMALWGSLLTEEPAGALKAVA